MYSGSEASSACTRAGTVRVRELDTWPFFTILTRERGVLFFGVGPTVWRSDGTEPGTFPLATDLLAQPGSFKADQRVTVEELTVAVGKKGMAVCRNGG